MPFDAGDYQACGAKTRKGGWCKQPVVKGRERCRLHGGASPRGVMHPSTTHGRYSKDMPVALAEKFQRELEDTGGDGLIQEIAMCRAFIREMLGADPTTVDSLTRNRILKTVDRLHKMVEAQRKYETSKHRIMSHQQAALFLVTLQQSIVDNITDPDLLRRLARRHKELLRVTLPQRARPDELLKVEGPEPDEPEAPDYTTLMKLKELEREGGHDQ